MVVEVSRTLLVVKLRFFLNSTKTITASSSTEYDYSISGTA